MAYSTLYRATGQGRLAGLYYESVLAPLTKLFKVPEARRGLFPKQLEFLACRAKLRTNCSGRRAGKSHSTMTWLVEEWPDRPGQSSVFAALSQEHAIKIGWQAVYDLNHRAGWGAQWNATDGTFTWPNGFTLYFCGIKDRRSANFIRGVPKLHRVAVDECGQIGDALLQYAVEDCIEPAMADTDGDICLTGTPADTGVGFYEDQMTRCAATGAHFCWTAAENPHLQAGGAEYIARMLRERFGGDATNATYRREYLGHRVQEQGVLIYRAPPLDAFYEDAPQSYNYTSLGIDIGYSDGNGFCVLRSRDPEPGATILEVYREPEITLPRIAAIAERMRVEHGVSEIFVDTAGGGGRTIMETLARDYGLPAQAADKRSRRLRIEQVRSMLAAGTLKGVQGRCGQILEEWLGLPWNIERDDHREGFIDEACDALQYALQGSGFSQLTPWQVEETPEQVYHRRVQEVLRARKLRGRGGRR